MKVPIARVLSVTLGLSFVGAICGAVLGGLALIIAAAAAPGTSDLHSWAVALSIGALFGALFGAILAPLVGWVFLRRVSFGRAIAQTALGVLLGLAVGALVAPRASFAFGLLGFILAGIWLWISTRRIPRRPVAGTP